MSFFNVFDIVRGNPNNPSEDIHHGTVLDPAKFPDPKKLGRVKIKIPELDFGIPDIDLPWSQAERPGSSPNNHGSNGNTGAFTMPQKGAMMKVRFGGADGYSPVASGAPYAIIGKLEQLFNKVAPELQHLNQYIQNPIGNFQWERFEKGIKSFEHDLTQNFHLNTLFVAGGKAPKGTGASLLAEEEQDEGTVHWYTASPTDVPKSQEAKDQDQEAQAASRAGEEQPKQSAKYQCYSEDRLFFAVVPARKQQSKDGSQGGGQQQGQGNTDRGKKPTPITSIETTNQKVHSIRGSGNSRVQDTEVMNYWQDEETSSRVTGGSTPHVHIRRKANRIFVNDEGCWTTKEIAVKEDPDSSSRYKDAPIIGYTALAPTREDARNFFQRHMDLQERVLTLQARVDALTSRLEALEQR
jgi:hypothetical protein